MAFTKHFDVSFSDLQFLHDQVNYPTIKIVGYDVSGNPIYGYVDAMGGTVQLGLAGTFDPLDYGLYGSARVADGLRNVNGVFNNLTNAGTVAWGAVNEPFLRLVPSDYSHYTQTLLATSSNAYWGKLVNWTTVSADYSDHTANVVDYTPRMISQTITSSNIHDPTFGDDSGMATAIANGLETETRSYLATDGTTHTETLIRNVNSVALDPSLSGWNTLFGQFFDHGLDFIDKPGAGIKIKIALAPNDPLYRAPDLAHGDPGNTSITITRATIATTDAMGPEYTNHDTPYIDQNQTYGGDPQITDLLREWVRDPVTGDWRPGAELLDGHQTVAYHSATFDDAGAGMTTRTLPTLNELRAALTATDRTDLSWEDIANYRMRDTHGHLLDTDPAAGLQTKGTGQAIVLDMNPRVDAGHISAGAIDALNNAFGSTYANNFNPTTDPSHADVLSLGSLIVQGWINPADFSITSGLTTAQHDAVGEILLESIGDHYIAGDGRVNENFGLTAMHHVFHEDHNVQLVALEQNILGQSLAMRNAWQEHTSFTDANGNFVVSATDLSVAWDQDKLFEAAKFIVEMEYQHVAIDQYARRITPDLPEFVTYDSNINADISLEYAQAAFRFGHSQLREAIDTLDPNNTVNSAIQHYLLKDAFLNPADFAEVGAGAIAVGMTRQVSNELDEFVTPALQQSLLGQPLDLAAINIARGRDLGLPTLNETRKALYDALVAERADPNFGANGPHAKIQLDLLRPYNSWNEFGANMAHPESLANFIAAYSFDGDRAHAQAIIDADVLGVDQTYSSTFVDSLGATQTVSGTVTIAQATAFLTGALNPNGTYVQEGADGFDKVDLWLGGLAESHVIGGVLGSTFNAIFEDQMERLMDGDRFYYLYRLNLGLAAPVDLNAAVTTEQFKDIIERTTGATHLSGDVMSYADDYVDLSKKVVAGTTLMNSDGSERLIGGVNVDETMKNAHEYGDIIDAFATANNGYGVYSTTGRGIGSNGTSILVTNPENHSINNYILDQRPDSPTDNSNGNPTYGYDSHEVLVGTPYNDFLDSGDGDDTVYGDEGDDILIGNGGGDHVYGGDGNDVIFGGGGTAGADVEDFLDGGDGNDIIYGGQNNGAVEILIGGDGNDRLYGESGIEEITADRGDDYIDAGSDTDLVFAGDGNDYLFGGEGPDELQGQNGDDILNGGTGTDKLLGGEGDDIFFGGIGGGAVAGDSDELIGDAGVNAAVSVDASFDIADYADLSARMDVAANLNNQNLTAPAGTTPFEPFNQLYQDINGAVGTKFDDQFAPSATNASGAGLIGDANGNWLIGGSGNDVLQGNGGNDVIVGGSIRIDTLDGKYTLAGAPDPYTAIVATASNRASPNAVLGGGFLAVAALQQGGQPLFAAHFTELLKSAAYKDFVLGDSAADTTASAGNDIVVLTGNRADYSVTLLTATGAVASTPATVFAVKITDNGSAARLASDGTDLLIGIDSLRFADVTKTIAQLFNQTPMGSIDFAATSALVGFTSVGRLAPLSLLLDPDNITVGNPSGAVTIPASGYQWQTSANGGATWTNVATGNGVNQQNAAAHALSLGPTAGTLVRLNGTYTDGGGTIESATSAVWNAVVGNNGGQTLNGTASAIIGDVLFGLAGNDTLNGGAGDDRLVGGLGNDTLNGGAGIDRAVFGGTINNYSFALAGAGLTVNGPLFTEGTDTLNNIEELQFGTSTYHLVQGTNAADPALAGTAAADLLLGFAGDDHLDGAAGNDVILGGGADVMIGGAGNDNLSGDTGADTVLASLADGNDTYNGGDGVDTYNLSATSAAATVNLAAGTASSADTGSDTLTNFENAIGGSGADLFTASNGQNALTGGAGTDRFIFTSTASAGNNGSRDTIADFVTRATNNTTHDVLDLSVIDAITNQVGNQTFIWDPVAVANGNHARGHVGFHYQVIGGIQHTIIEGNTSSNASSHDFQIDLIGNLSFTTTGAVGAIDLIL